MRTTLGKPKTTTIRILLDTGSSGTLVTQKHVEKLRVRKNSETTWHTSAGNFKTFGKSKIEFKLPEFYEKRIVQRDIHVTQKLGNYDMIIGRDILEELGIDIKYSDNTITWDEATIPMKPIDATLKDEHLMDSEAVEDATDRMKQILEAKYEKADLETIINEYEHLTEIQKDGLKELLQRFEGLFDGTLGKWKNETYDVEL